MSMDGQGTIKCHRNRPYCRKFYPSQYSARALQTRGRQATDGRATAYTERERELVKSVATVSLSDGLSTELGPSRLSPQLLVPAKLRGWVKCGFSSAATSAFYTFKIRTSADLQIRILPPASNWPSEVTLCIG